MNDHMINEKRWNALRTALLTATAVMLVLSAVMGSAWAYFTTYCRAKGGYPIVLGHEEHEEEKFKQWNKELSIKISDDSNPVYLRARAFCADYELSYSDKIVEKDGGETVNEKWVGPDNKGWVYYTEIVGKDDKRTADSLFVRINNVPDNKEEGALKGDEFNVIIVYEATRVQYDDDGNELPWDRVDWTKKVDTHRTSADSTEKTETSSDKPEGGDK